MLAPVLFQYLFGYLFDVIFGKVFGYILEDVGVNLRLVFDMLLNSSVVFSGGVFATIFDMPAHPWIYKPA